MRGLHILVVAPAAGELQLLLGGQHGEFADFLEVPGQVALRGDVGDGRDHGRFLSSDAVGRLPLAAGRQRPGCGCSRPVG